MELHKGTNGWRARTDIDMPDVIAHGGKDGRTPGHSVLRIETSKSRLGISTIASIHWAADTGSMIHAMGLGTGCGDYYRTVTQSGARCTEKAIKAMHELAMNQEDVIKAEVRTFYAVQRTQ